MCFTEGYHGETIGALSVGGMGIYPAEYLKRLRKLCDRYNVLLIADEIATGFGRTGKMFACNYADISLDIMCLSKGLTGGYMPMAITVITDKIYSTFYGDYNDGKAFMHSHTYSGNPLACSAALAVLKIIHEESVLKKAITYSYYLNKKLKCVLLDHGNVEEIRSVGLINAIELVEDKETKVGFNPKLRIGYQIYQEALKRGLVLRPLGSIIF